MIPHMAVALRLRVDIEALPCRYPKATLLNEFPLEIVSKLFHFWVRAVFVELGRGHHADDIENLERPKGHPNRNSPGFIDVFKTHNASHQELCRCIKKGHEQ